jgi:hypothetical protein
MKLQWTDDPQAESQLSALGLAWTRADVSFSQVDVTFSLKNNARLDKPLCEDTAMEYACAMLDGAKFPAIVLRMNGGGKYRVLSGNHRVGGVEILIDNGDLDSQTAIFERAYVITSDDPAMIELVTRAANRWQGRRQGKTEAFEHARWMMQRYSMTVQELSKHFCLPVKWLKDRLRAETIRAEIQAAGTPTSNLNETQIVKLGQLDFNRRLQQRAAAVAQEYKLKNDEVKNLVDKVKVAAQNGEQSGIETMKELEGAYRATKLRVPEASAANRRPIRARFYTHLNGFHNFLKCGNKGKSFSDLDQIQIANKHDRHEAHEIWKQLKKALDTLFHDSVAKGG